MSGDGIRWEVKNNPQPRGFLSSAPAPRELTAVRAAIEGKPVEGFRTFSPGPMMLFEGAVSPSQCDKVREMLVDGFTPAEIMAAVQPMPPPRWRWWRDPFVWIAVIGAAALAVTYFLVIP